MAPTPSPRSLLPALVALTFAVLALAPGAWAQQPVVRRQRRPAPTVIVPPAGSVIGNPAAVAGVPVAAPVGMPVGNPVAPPTAAPPAADPQPGGPAQQVAPPPPGQAIGSIQNAAGNPDSMHGFDDNNVAFRPLPPGARITFNLQDADLPDLVRAIGNITGRRFIIPGKVRSIKTTIYSPTKITAGEAYQAFLSVLAVNGMTVIPSGRYLKIEETAGAATQVLPTYNPGSETPADDRFITRIVRLRNMAPDDASNLLGHFKSRDGDITPYATTNTLIITDTGANIRRMLQILAEVDVAAVGEQIWVEPVHFAVASELQARINEILGGGNQPAAGQARPGGGDLRLTRILADDRSNSLVIVATQRMYLRVLELMRRLDVSIEGEGQVRVFRLQHADAEEMAQTLNNITGGGRAQGNQQGRGQQAIFEGQIRITADKPTNALVITSSPRDYLAVRRVIDELDRSRRQVFIEAVIVELQVNRTNRLGINFHGALPIGQGGADGAGLGGFFPLTSITLADPNVLSGLALGVRGSPVQGSQNLLPGVSVAIPAFGVTLAALATTGDANVLATPNIIATDNVAADINVGQNVPLQTNVGAGLSGLAGGQSGALGALGALGAFGGGFAAPRQDVGTKIRINPHINDSGEVRLEIEEEISEVGASTGQLGAVSINRRTAKTTTVVRDQNTVVIGGLIRTSETNSEERVPILGDIPILGALFRRTTRTLQRSNLLLFLTPYVIRDQSDLRRIFERKMRERQEFIDRYFVFSDTEYEPPMDYTRTNGLVEEIRQSIREQRARVELEDSSRPEAPPPHEPSEPIEMPAEMRPPGATPPPAGGNTPGAPVFPNAAGGPVPIVAPIVAPAVGIPVPP
ncbi:MAG: type II secretion system secretin GspD [Polyangiales bacterium]